MVLAPPPNFSRLPTFLNAPRCQCNDYLKQIFADLIKIEPRKSQAVLNEINVQERANPSFVLKELL